MRIHRLAGVGVTVALALGASPAAARSHLTTERASAGGVTATFTYTGENPNYAHQHLTISRAGITLYSAAVRSQYCDTLCWPGSLPNRTGSVHVVDLEHNGSRDVVLDLYSGGAHCCSVEQIFALTPGSRAVRATERDFGDPGSRLVDLGHDGRLEFLTADDRFADAFTSFAGSGLPIEVLTFARGHFTNVTRRYPALIRRDAAEWLRIYRGLRSQHWQDTVGVIAAWAADEDMLGRSAYVARYLGHEAAAGHLNNATEPRQSAQRYIAALNRFLKRAGYLR